MSFTRYDFLKLERILRACSSASKSVKIYAEPAIENDKIANTKTKAMIIATSVASNGVGGMKFVRAE